MLARATLGRRSLGRRSLASVAHVLATDGSISLANSDPEGVLKPGDSIDDGGARVLFNTVGGTSALSESLAVGSKNLKINVSTRFSNPPKDSERTIISEGWHTGVAFVDLMCPVAKGQSMLLLGPNESSLKKLHDSLLPGGEVVVDGDGDVSDARYVLEVHAAIDRAYASDKKHCVVLLGNVERLMRLWTDARSLAYSSLDDPFLPKIHIASDRSELRSFYSSIYQRAACTPNKTVTILSYLRVPWAAPNFELDFDTGNVKTLLQNKSFELDQRLRLQHHEELQSIGDGQIFLDFEGKPCMKRSLSRVGVGSVKSGADVRAPELRGKANGLRIALNAWKEQDDFYKTDSIPVPLKDMLNDLETRRNPIDTAARLEEVFRV